VNCREAAARIYEYLDRELTEEVALEIEHHLEACAACYDQFEFQRAFLGLLARHGSAIRAPEELRRRVEGLLRDDRARQNTAE
jgi:mycothiol system anti-sigma-R factor